MANLDGRTQIARAEVNRSGDWRTPSRMDMALNPPLGPPVASSSTWTPPPPKPVPSEAALRQQLADAITARSDATTTLQRAEAAHERAERQLQQCRKRLADVAVLHQEMTARTIAALRDGKPVAAAMTEELPDQQRAQLEAQTAEQALVVFRQERASAAQRLGNLARSIDALVAQVLAHRAHDLARVCLELEAEIARRRVALLAFDRLATPARIPLTFEIQRVIGQTTSRPLRPDELQAWTDAAAQLREDAEAAVEIALPPLEPIAIMRPTFGSSVTHMVPIAPPSAPVPTVQDDGDPYLTETDNA
jgi:hypothetical protein